MGKSIEELLSIVRIGGYLTASQRDAVLSEIEHLRKEKEWLVCKVINMCQRMYCTDQPEEELKEILLEEMQQALKGE